MTWLISFREASLGEFRVEAKLDQAALGFLPQWPGIDRIRGTLTFDRAAMDLTAESAATLGVGLREISARIPDLARPVIAIRGLAQGPLATMLQYVHASPIGRGVDPQVKAWQTGGTADLALDLDIGLGQGAQPATAARWFSTAMSSAWRPVRPLSPVLRARSASMREAFARSRSMPAGWAARCRSG